MYHYTPNKHILRGLQSSRGAPPWQAFDPNKQWNFVKQYTSDYAEYVAFANHYEHVNFFSPTRVAQVPVNGVLFDVSLFEEEQI